ncbi:MAG: TetR/AcrR family transcriptional regulator [Ilumatobacteraceae bacterium]
MTDAQRASAAPSSEATGQRRTRGGWIAAGTGAERRARHVTHGTPRGHRTRTKIVDAAQQVFVQKGYLDTTVEDIIAEAGVARGTFYTYFTDRLDALRVVAERVIADIIEQVESASHVETDSLIERIDQANRGFISSYKQHEAISVLVEQLLTVDESLRQLRLEARRREIERLAAAISRWQRAGSVDATLDPPIVAELLFTMRARFCYYWCLGGQAYDEDAVVRAMTLSWCRILGVRDGE